MLGIEIPLGLPDRLAEPELISSTVAPDGDNNHLLGLYYRVEFEVLNNWTNFTLFMRGSIGFEMEKPDVTDNSTQFLINLYGQKSEKRILAYQTLII